MNFFLFRHKIYSAAEVKGVMYDLFHATVSRK